MASKKCKANATLLILTSAQWTSVPGQVSLRSSHNAKPLSSLTRGNKSSLGGVCPSSPPPGGWKPAHTDGNSTRWWRKSCRASEPPPPPPLLVVRQLESKKSSSSLCPGRQAAAHQGAVRGIPSSTLMFCPAGLRLIMQASKCQDGRQVHIQSLESVPKSKRLKTPLLALASCLSQSLSALRLNRERTKSLFRYWGKLKLNVYQLIERF